MDNVKHFETILKEILDTYTKKNKDYGNSFDKTLDKWGPNIALARIEDKLNRVAQLVNSDEAQVKDESVEDTLKDLATYAIMFLMWHQKHSKSSEELMLKTTQLVPISEISDFVDEFPKDTRLELKLQKYLHSHRIVRKGLNNSGYNPTYVLGDGELTSIKVKGDKVYAHFDNITKNNKRVGSGTADVVYPVEELYSYGLYV